jgi:hypothetical protein
MTYPKWVNRGLGDSQVILCLNAEEEAAFVGKPADPAPSTPVAEAAEPETIESLRAKLDAAGIAYDKRWGAGRLAELLPKG